MHRLCVLLFFVCAAHDATCFTEGLFIHNGQFYESAAEPSRVLTYGLNGRVRHVHLPTDLEYVHLYVLASCNTCLCTFLPLAMC